MKNFILLFAAIIALVSCGEKEESRNETTITAEISTHIEASSVVDDSVVLKASITSDQVDITNYGFCYFTSPDVDIDNSYVGKSTDKDDSGNFSYTITDIKTDQDYYIRAYASYKDQVWYSEEYHLSTELSEYVTTEPVQIRARVGAIGEGKLLSKRSNYTSWGFCLDTEENPTVEKMKFEASKAENAVSEEGDFGVFFDELTPLTTYYVRSYVESNDKIHYGNQVSFMTTKGANITYTLNKADDPTADELDAYGRIVECVDSAIYYFHRYCNKQKVLTVNYVPSVPTADASAAGNIRFGESRSYMWVGTTMHEFNHTFGSGTSTNGRALYTDGWYTERNANIVLKVFLEDYTRTIQCDKDWMVHFWPGGINYASEVESERDLKMNAMLMEGMIMDGMTQ
ncbi:MAG: hypothetical protein R3Y08_08025 [Rikenellaceae bacterium]